MSWRRNVLRWCGRDTGCKGHKAMKVIQTDIPGLLVFEPKVFGDERGFFFESYNR